MLHAEQIEELINIVSSLDRDMLIDQFHSFRASFPVDFSRDFLQHQTVDRLRHLFIALCLQQQRMPEIAAPEAA